MNSVQRQRMLEVAEAARAEAAALLYTHRMQLAVDAAAPEFEKALQFRIIRRQVEFLPDEALQQSRMVRQMIDDLGCGQSIPPHLQLIRIHVRPFRCHTPLKTRMPRGLLRGNRKAQ